MARDLDISSWFRKARLLVEDPSTRRAGDEEIVQRIVETVESRLREVSLHFRRDPTRGEWLIGLENAKALRAALAAAACDEGPSTVRRNRPLVPEPLFSLCDTGRPDAVEAWTRIAISNEPPPDLALVRDALRQAIAGLVRANQSVMVWLPADGRASGAN